MVDTFIQTHTSLSIQGEEFHINQNCPAEVNPNSECSYSMPWSSYAIIGISTASVCVIVIIIGLLLVGRCIFSSTKKQKKEIATYVPRSVI